MATLGRRCLISCKTFAEWRRTAFPGRRDITTPHDGLGRPSYEVSSPFGERVTISCVCCLIAKRTAKSGHPPMNYFGSPDQTRVRPSIWAVTVCWISSV